MEGLPNIADAIRKMTEAYADGLSLMTKTLESVPKQSADRSGLEQWVRLARMSKDAFVTALEQGFQLWERESRRMLDAASAGAPPSPENPFEVWAENWKKTLDGFTAAAKAGDAWSEQARKQAALVQQTMQEGMKAWQRLWQPPERRA